MNRALIKKGFELVLCLWWGMVAWLAEGDKCTAIDGASFRVTHICSLFTITKRLISGLLTHQVQAKVFIYIYIQRCRENNKTTVPPNIFQTRPVQTISLKTDQTFSNL